MELFPLPPLVIPQTQTVVLHDVTTRLGRAYERRAAFVASVGKQSAETVQVLVDAANARSSFIGLPSKRDQDLLRECRECVKACYKRLQDLEDIRDALEYEVAEAKREEGRGENQYPKPTKTLGEWDAELMIAY